jgi:hypothetical protein
MTSIVFVAETAIVVCGCSDSHMAPTSNAIAQKPGLHLVAASRMLPRKCRVTARAVGYASDRGLDVVIVEQPAMPAARIAARLEVENAREVAE